MATTSANSMNTVSGTTVISMRPMVMGVSRLTPCRVVSQRNTIGGTTQAISTTQPMPIIATSASDRIAGCLATISVPMPTNISAAEIITLWRYSFSRFCPVRYSYSSPSVMNIV